MADRWLTFSEARELLGVTPDDLRELMEAGTLQGQVVDGVVKFDEADVKRMARGGPSKGGETHLRFLVDEEDEKKIEGKAYDGEALAPPKAPQRPGEEEDLVAPMDLSEEQLRNSDLLGGRDIVEFGREVAERSTAAEFTHAELAGEEEILEPSEVELPEVEFGPLAGRVPEARREEPPEPVEEAAIPGGVETPPESPLAELRAALKPEPPPPPPEDEILFVAEEPTPMMCPTTEEAKKEAEAPRPVSIVPPIVPETPTIKFVEETLKVEETPEASPPASETPEAPVAARAKPEAPAVTPVETPVETPAEPAETYEVETPAPVEPVTMSLGFAVDEETAEVVPEEAAPAPEMEAPTDESAAEPASMEAPEAETVESWEPEEAPAEEAAVTPEPVTPQALAAGAVSAAAAEALAASAKLEKPAEPPPKAPAPPPPAEPARKGVDEARAREIMEEIERELAAESAKEPLPRAAEHDTISARSSQQSQGLVPKRSGPAEVPQEEAKPVTDEMKKPKPGEPPKVKKPEDIEVFDFEQPGAKKEEEFELLEEEPVAKESAPAGAAPAKEKSLEEEMAELFGEEAKEAPLDQAFAAPQAPAKPEEDFDLSVFQKDKQEEAAAEPAAITEEKLFEVESPRAETHEAASDAEMQSVSRIRAISEERTPASVYLYTTAVIVAVLVVACAGMLLWYFAILRQ